MEKVKLNYLNFDIVSMPRNYDYLYLYLLYSILGLFLPCLLFLYDIPRSFWKGEVDIVVVGFVIIWIYSTMIVMGIHEFLKPDMSIFRVFVGLYYIVFVVVMVFLTLGYIIPVSILNYSDDVLSVVFWFVVFFWLEVAGRIHDYSKTALKDKLKKK